MEEPSQSPALLEPLLAPMMLANTMIEPQATMPFIENTNHCDESALVMNCIVFDNNFSQTNVDAFSDLIQELKLPEFNSESDSIFVDHVALNLKFENQCEKIIYTEIDYLQLNDTVINTLESLTTEKLISDLDFPGYGKYKSLTVDDVISTIYENAHKSELQKVSAINDCFNKVTYLDDMTHWGVEDYWATPLEFISTGGGDCEDYAIAKYITLKDMGVPESKLYLTYCKYDDLGHMFLSYMPTPYSVPLVLDNINTNLLPLTQRTDLEVVYSINKNGIWASQNDVLLNYRINSGYHWSAWNSLNARLNAENYTITYWI